jgi:hypothetical protein
MKAQKHEVIESINDFIEKETISTPDIGTKTRLHDLYRAFTSYLIYKDIDIYKKHYMYSFNLKQFKLFLIELKFKVIQETNIFGWYVHDLILFDYTGVNKESICSINYPKEIAPSLEYFDKKLSSSNNSTKASVIYKNFKDFLKENKLKNISHRKFYPIMNHFYKKYKDEKGITFYRVSIIYMTIKVPPIIISTSGKISGIYVTIKVPPIIISTSGKISGIIIHKKQNAHIHYS